MEFQSVSRWDATPIKSSSKGKISVFALSGCALCLVSIGGYLWIASPGAQAHTNTNISSGLAEELRNSLGEIDSFRDPELVKNVAQLAARVKSLEAENQRLSAEMTQLIDHDGVIERLVTHIRALHAQNEATRRDVVNAMMGPTPESDPTLNPEGLDPALLAEGAESPFLSKAKHTIVTPVAAAPAEEEPKPAAKPRSKVAQAEPDEGATN